MGDKVASEGTKTSSSLRSLPEFQEKKIKKKKLSHAHIISFDKQRQRKTCVLSGLQNLKKKKTKPLKESAE